MAALLLPGPLHAAALPDGDRPLVVYSDGMKNGWQDGSWAKTATLPDWQGNRALQPLQVDAAGWAAVAFRNAGFDTHRFRVLTFAVNGGAAGGQTLAVVPVVGGKALTEHAWPFTLPAGGRWGRVVVPLAELGLAGQPIDGFWIQNRSPGPAATFWLEDVAFN